MGNRLVIFGGSGFVGKAIARAGLAAGLKVASVSRSGKPKDLEEWMHEVEWIKGDAFQPDSWRDELKDEDVVVDAVGILLENKAKGITYDRFHYQVAAITSAEARAAKVAGYAYVSAKHWVPFFLKGYLEAKLKAEKRVLENRPDAIIERPSLMAGKDRKGSELQNQLVLFAKKIPGVQLFLKELEPEEVDDVADRLVQKIKQHLAN